MVRRVLVADDAELQERPVILISSFDEGEVEWRDAGANLFVQKPIDIVALPDVVERLLPDEPPPEKMRRELAA